MVWDPFVMLACVCPGPGVRVRLGFLDRSADGVARRAHIGDVATLNAIAGPVARTEHYHLASFSLTEYHRRNAERPDIHGGKNAVHARGRCGRHYSARPFWAICLGHGPSEHRR